MAYHVNFEKQREYLKVSVSGERTLAREPKDAIELVSQMAAACQQHGLTRVMIVSDISTPLPTMAAFDVASKPEEYGWSRSYRTAIVNSNAKVRTANEFVENVAVNRGFQVKVFADQETALAWLLQ